MQFRQSICWLAIGSALLFSSAFCEELQLRGLTELQQVSVRAKPVGSKLFAKCRPTNFRCVKLEVVNDLATPILIDGDKAQATASGQVFQQATQKEIIADSGCAPTAFAKAMLVAATLSSAGLAGPIASEMVHKRECLGVPCGKDEVRLSVAEIRLGKRILMPGDKTTGLLCFSIPAAGVVPDSLEVKITIPVVTKAPEEVSGQVEVQTSLLK